MNGRERIQSQKEGKPLKGLESSQQVDYLTGHRHYSIPDEQI